MKTAVLTFLLFIFSSIAIAQHPLAKLWDKRFGGSISGPAYFPKLYDGRDKTFWFASYETSFAPEGVNNLTPTVPLAAWKQGDFSGLKGAWTLKGRVTMLKANTGSKVEIQVSTVKKGESVSPGRWVRSVTTTARGANRASPWIRSGCLPRLTLLLSSTWRKTSRSTSRRWVSPTLRPTRSTS